QGDVQLNKALHHVIVALGIVEAAGIPVGAVQAVEQRIVARTAGGAAGTADGAVTGAVATNVIGFLAPGAAEGHRNRTGPVLDRRAGDREVKIVLHLVRDLDRARTPVAAAIDPVLRGLAGCRAKGIEGHATQLDRRGAAADDGAGRDAHRGINRIVDVGRAHLNRVDRRIHVRLQGDAADMDVGVVLAMLVIALPVPLGVEQVEDTVGAADITAVVALGVNLLRAQAVIKRAEAEAGDVVGDTGRL